MHCTSFQTVSSLVMHCTSFQYLRHQMVDNITRYLITTAKPNLYSKSRNWVQLNTAFRPQNIRDPVWTILCQSGLAEAIISTISQINMPFKTSLLKCPSFLDANEESIWNGISSPPHHLVLPILESLLLILNINIVLHPFISMFLLQTNILHHIISLLAINKASMSSIWCYTFGWSS